MPKPSKNLSKDHDASEVCSALNQSSNYAIFSTDSANASPESTSVSMTETLLKSISAAVADEGQHILTSVNETIGKLEIKMDNLVKRIDDAVATTAALVARQAEVEIRVSHLEDDIAPIIKRLDALEKTNKELKDKVTDLECRQRRKNIRLLNLKELMEGNDPNGFFEGFIPELLHLPVTSVPIDRAHRGFGTPGDGRPRPVIVKFQRFRDVSVILEAVKRLGNLQHEGCPLRIVLIKKFIKKNIRFRMAYPAILSFKVNGIFKTFKDPNEAKAFLSVVP